MNPFESTTTKRIEDIQPIMKYFTYAHLPARLQSVSKNFAEIAEYVEKNLPAGPEKSVALRKLLEAKDAAVRAALE